MIFDFYLLGLSKNTVFKSPINCMIKIRGEWQRQCCRYRIAETHNLLLVLDFYSCIALNDCIAIKHGKCYERSACRMVFIFQKC